MTRSTRKLKIEGSEFEMKIFYKNNFNFQLQEMLSRRARVCDGSIDRHYPKVRHGELYSIWEEQEVEVVTTNFLLKLLLVWSDVRHQE